MLSIKDYLQKFKKLAPPCVFVREKVQGILSNRLHVDIPIEKITMRNKTVFIRESGIVKNTIFFQKKQILKALEEEIGIEKTPTDIR